MIVVNPAVILLSDPGEQAQRGIVQGIANRGGLGLHDPAISHPEFIEFSIMLHAYELVV